LPLLEYEFLVALQKQKTENLPVHNPDPKINHPVRENNPLQCPKRGENIQIQVSDIRNL
jgi:hypothetical protein